MLQGDPAARHSANFEIVIKKCNETTLAKEKITNDDGSKIICKNPEQINKFVNNIEVDTW